MLNAFFEVMFKGFFTLARAIDNLLRNIKAVNIDVAKQFIGT